MKQLNLAKIIITIILTIIPSNLQKFFFTIIMNVISHKELRESEKLIASKHVKEKKK